jgi:acyl-CoA synthetase (AMP-forming)/AMP-acid ligase II
LQAISEFRADISGGPNFAFATCVRRIRPDQRAKLDLSSWRVAFCGAEPISAGTLDAFGEVFADCGFRPDSFLPCYGLAESTLLVASCPADEPAVIREIPHDRTPRSLQGPAARRRVSSGRPVPGQEVLIVDPESCLPCRAEDVGEIWVAGESVAQGYWAQPDATREAFDARLATGEGPYLRTGDMGCLLDGELFIVGRRKDTIIVDGKNHHPEDIERTVEQCLAANPVGMVAVFSIEVDSLERVVVVAELDRSQHRQLRSVYREEAPSRGRANGHVSDKHFNENLVQLIRCAVSEEHGLNVHEVAFVKPASIPKTSSGKVRRSECRLRFLDGSLERLA